MKKSLLLTLVCILVLAVGSVPSQSSFALFDVKTQGQDALAADDGSKSLAIATFNIQFLGLFPDRDNTDLAEILKNFDIVVIQELVAPPYKGKIPACTPSVVDDFEEDPESKEFFDAMQAVGFLYELSCEDTGTNKNNHNNGSATEWWVVFYKDAKVKPAVDLPTGFLADDRTANEDYDRVPYAFAFRTPDENLDFVLISVHLRPGATGEDKDRREGELRAIAKWVKDHDEDKKERDFIILGDMNIEDCDELRDATPYGFISLNNKCVATNTNVNSPKPYDHVMYRPGFTTTKEIDKSFGFRVFNLIEAMRPFWNSPDDYPGGAVNPIDSPAYDHDKFRMTYSDHHPVVFMLTVPDKDDDP